MSWLKQFLQSEAFVEPGTFETNASGATDNIDSISVGLETATAPDNRDRILSEEIKRRQVAMTLRYVLFVRAR